MDMKLGDGLKKLVLMGIGAAALTAEKSQQIVDELVKRGEITVEQGKELNKELQHNVKKTMEARKLDAETIEQKLAKMSADEIELLKSKIREAEEAIEDITNPVQSEEEKAEADLDELIKKEGYAPADNGSEEKAEA